MSKEVRAGQVYRHYKGDVNDVLHVAHHHETRSQMVVYWSRELNSINVRPLRGTETDPDGWLDPTENGEQRFILIQETLGAGLPQLITGAKFPQLIIAPPFPSIGVSATSSLQKAAKKAVENFDPFSLPAECALVAAMRVLAAELKMEIDW